jgi:hypothetical protein
MERMQDPSLGKGKNDFLNGFLEAKKDNPESVTDNEVIGWLILNVRQFFLLLPPSLLKLR